MSVNKHNLNLHLMNKEQMKEFMSKYPFRINFGREGCSACFSKADVIKTYKYFKGKRPYMKIERRKDDGTWVPMKFASKE